MTRGAIYRAAVALAVYVGIAAVYTHPLLSRSREAIASDRYDPVLNASILWWNATTLPFSSAWWTPPHYYPSERIAAFTENLAGLGPIATPLLHATNDPLLTYNLTTFLTWPLSALAVFLLATSLGARVGPAFVGGLVFGFAPYRVAQMPHLQVLACFWLPLALAALHVYLKEPRTRWLVLFGAAWLLQALTNGYFMLFGGVLIGLWLLYFCSTRATVRLLPAIMVAWVVASLPLLPVLLEYKRVHEAYGLQRSLGAIIQYSAQASAWVQTPNLLWSWSTVLRDGGGEANLFPGATAVIVVIAAAAAMLARRRRPAGSLSPRLPVLRAILLAVAVIASLMVIYTVAAGPWRWSVAGMSLRVSSVDRALLVAVAAWGVFAWLGGRRWPTGTAERSAFVFYALATVAIVILSMGPQLRSGTRVVLESAPYSWLLVLPGFEGLRVPTRFWMLGAMCLATAAALGLERLLPASRVARTVLVLLVSAGVLLDGWVREMPMGRAPEHWPRVQRRDIPHPLIELPLGPEYDAAATYRAVRHRRRVVNGVSGYDPPHYDWLRRGLNARDPGALLALASFGTIDIIVDRSTPEGPELAQYVTSTAGVEFVNDDGVRALYRLTPRSGQTSLPGNPLPIATGRTSSSEPDLGPALDGDTSTAWSRVHQAQDEWIELDLATISSVSGIALALGADIGGYPRSFAIELSTDRTAWSTVWQGSGFQHALAALMRSPQDPRMSIPFGPLDARFVRLRLLDGAEAEWRIADIVVHGRAAAAGG